MNRQQRWVYHVIICVVITYCAAAGQSAFAQDRPENENEITLVHVVQPGDTLDSIADLYAISPQALLDANGLASAVDVTIGQRLVIPQIDPTTTTTQLIVGIGDTLYNLSLRYGVPPDVLGRINRVVNPSLLYAGQTLIVPPARQGRAEQIGLVRATRERTLWRIAFQANANPIAVALHNGLPDPLVVPPGQIISLRNEADQAGSMLSTSWSSLALHPLPLQAGRSSSLMIETATPGTVTGSFMGSELHFVSDQTIHYSVFSVNRWTAPGLYPITVSFAGQTYTRQVLVVDGGYTQETIRLSEEDSAVLADTQTVQEESAYISHIMSGFTPVRRWTGLFHLPTSGVMSSAYGTARSYNGGGYNSFHGGSDFVAPASTPVYAPAAGVVVDAGFLNVRGYFAVIDHGWGVYSGFWHQSTVLVSAGDTVDVGQQIGTVGSTGLSTAAHLHWEMWVAGNQVDPLQWAREVFP